MPQALSQPQGIPSPLERVLRAGGSLCGAEEHGFRSQRDLEVSPGAASCSPCGWVSPSSLHLSFLTCEMGVITMPTSQSCKDIIEAWRSAQLLVCSQQQLLKDLKELGMWLLTSGSLSQPQRGGRCQGGGPGKGGKQGRPHGYAGKGGEQVRREGGRGMVAPFQASGSV